MTSSCFEGAEACDFPDSCGALIAIDKGETGARAFAEAFAEWEREDDP
jgi:hypothetical protein